MSDLISSLGWKKWVTIITVVVVGVILLAAGSELVEYVNADEVMVIQRPMGALDWYISPGWKYQGLGRATHYQKREIYNFQQDIRFNDGGEAQIHGSIQYEMPLSVELLTDLHTKFGSQQAVATQLIATIVNKSIYMSGPLMSSRESYAERRNDLIFFIQDQVENGVYNTTQQDVTVIDELSGEERTIAVVEIATDENGLAQRQEASVLAPFGIIPFNLAIENMPYGERVTGQIAEQQQVAMDVQLAIADAKKAEQRTITVEEQGKANAAEAKWKQEQIKAQQVTEAQQRLEVAQLDRKAAVETKQQQILLGQGEAERKRLVMQADGALQIKVDAWKEVQIANAAAIAAYKGNWVPTIIQGGGGTSGSNNQATQLLEILGLKAARDLTLDMEMKGNN